MIGVISKRDQIPIVEEFFQLFKTAWEWYQPGRRYDVVLATADEVPEVEARLVVVCGASAKSTDARDGLVMSARHQGLSVTSGARSQRLYRDVATFAMSPNATPCVTRGSEPVGLRVTRHDRTLLRLGYDLFDEVAFLLTSGQPVESAAAPTLDTHISLLREWILSAGIPLVEIPPTPAGHEFVVCLTHDIDFIGIRQHRFDHSMLGFLYRSTVGSVVALLRGRLSVSRAFKVWRAAASLPFVYLGLIEDFWEPFGWYLKVERNLPATYFLIPFKGRAGDKVGSSHGSRRATKYDVDDLHHWGPILLEEGCELGVHGIDAWHSVEKGREERQRLAAMNGRSSIGVRMHWLLQDGDTASVLEQAGFAYDSTRGYNETIGFRNGTAQVYRPLDAHTLLELPLHIQDGALFFPDRLGLSEAEAERRCDALIEGVRCSGGVVTVLWHDRSHGPERFWGDFYIGLIDRLKASGAWFGTAAQVVDWFAQRRNIRFERAGDGLSVRGDAHDAHPPFVLRTHRPNGPTSSYTDVRWEGDTMVALDASLRPAQVRPGDAPFAAGSIFTGSRS